MQPIPAPLNLNNNKALRCLLFLYMAQCYSTFPVNLFSKPTEKSLVVVVCSYNNQKWLEKNLGSIFGQEYFNYRVIYIDDYSTDSTSNLVKKYIKKHKLQGKCTVIKNKKRCYKLHNLYHAIHNYCNDSDIVIEIDGDDWLLSNDVFTMINDIYTHNNVWLTYGGFRMWPKQLENLITQDIPESVATNNKFRSFFNKGFIFLALRTFYAGLFKKINYEDLLYDGKLFTRSSDVATMIPMFEMAGKRTFHIKKPVYLYNTDTGYNDRNQEQGRQFLLTNLMRGKLRYNKLKQTPF